MQRLGFILFLALSGYSVFSQNSLPKIRNVVNEFYGIYNTDELEYREVSFEKRKEGWYIVTQRIADGELVPVDKLLFYDNLTKKYKTLSIKNNLSRKEVNPSDYLDEYSLRNYDAQYFYGYKGWYKDVINEFSDRKELSDDEMNGLARAYSTYAGGLLTDQSGDVPQNEIWKLPLKINCLTPDQIMEFNALEAKAQGYFKKIAERNPDFETIVGKISLKYANEVMDQYRMLLAHANDYAAQMKLPSDLYTEGQLEVARKNLENCPSNAILLSFGDNDFYPVHYLQKVKGIRKDVYLINYSLIGLDRYIYRATFPQYESEAIQLSVDTSMYSGKKNEIVYIRDSSNSFMFSQIPYLLKYGIKNDYGSFTLAAKEIFLAKEKTMKKDGSGVGVVAVVSLKEVKYLFKKQWILLDIIENLNGRKICFSYNSEDELKGLNQHLSRKGDLWIY